MTKFLVYFLTVCHFELRLALGGEARHLGLAVIVLIRLKQAIKYERWYRYIHDAVHRTESQGLRCPYSPVWA